MAYKITIEKVETVEREKQVWVELSADYRAELKKLHDSGVATSEQEIEYMRGGAYVPRIERERDSTTILQQTVDTLDLAAVIKAVNGL